MTVYSISGFTDPFSSMVHYLAAFVFLVAGIRLLVKQTHSRSELYSVGVLVFSTVVMLSLSATYHLLDQGSTGRAVLQRLDHAAIFFLIAGTFTPVHTLLFQGFLRWGILLIIWILAICGIVFKSIFFNDMPEWLGLIFYLGMGWFGVFTGYLLTRRFDIHFITYLLWGAAAYTSGAVIEFMRAPVLVEGVIGPHEIFHIAVIIGVACHWQFIVVILRKNQSQTIT